MAAYVRSHASLVSIVGGLMLLFGAPFTASAVDVVTAWNLPASAGANYDFGNDVVLQGEWLLPADWVGNIYVYQNGVQMHDKSNPTANCAATPAPVECYIPINNIGGGTPLSGTFNFNIGPQTEGAHNIQVKFWGGSWCAVKSQLNSATPPPNPLYTGTCPPDETNFNPGQIYPLRTYTVNLPLYPRITVTPASNPALDFANVPTGSQEVKSFSVLNSGQQTLIFTVSGVSAPYYCVGGTCTQTVAMGQTKVVQIQFVPDAVATYPMTAVFTCSGAPLPCDVPSTSRTVAGNGVGGALPPRVSVVSGGTLDFGTFYYQNPSSVDRNMRIKNVGGGLLNGILTFPTTEYTCIGGCNYSIFAGDEITKIVRFTPIAAGMGRSDTANLSDGGTGATVNLISNVDNTPVLEACVYNCYYPWNAGTVNIGDNREINVYVRNTGSGFLSGQLTGGLPARGFTFIPNAGYPYANITPAMSWVQIGKFRFEPSDALPAEAYPVFSNVTPPGGNSDTLYLVAQGNDQPVVGLSGTTVAFGPVVVTVTKTATLTVTNTGVGILNVSIPVGPLANPAFSCVINCTLSLGAGVSGTITFSFTPSAVGLYSTTVNVGGTNVSLTGNGILPAARVYAQNASGAWSLLPVGVPIEYGVTTYGSPVENKLAYVQVQSTGGVGTRVNYSFDTSAAPHFTCTAWCAGTVSADPGFSWYRNASVEFRPRNAPGGPGDYTETITVNYDFNDGVPRTYTYQAHGNSVASPYITITPVSRAYTWPPTVVGNAPTTIFNVKNEGIGPMSGAVNIPVSGGIIGHWTFDAANMNFPGNQAFDSSGSGITGTLVGAPASAVGYFGDALGFGPGKSVNLGAVSTGFNIAGDVTGTAWIKTSTNGKMIMQYQNGNPLIYMSVGATTAGGSANKFVVYLRTNGGGVAVFSSNRTVTDGVWHQVAFVRSAMTSKVKLYVDGVLDSTFNWTDAGAISTSGGSHTISNASYPFSGDIDDVRVYSRALSSSEVSQLYTGAVVVYDPVFKCISPIPCTFNNLNPGDPAIPFTFSFTPADAFTYTSIPLFSSDGGNLTVSLLGTGVFQPVITITPVTVNDPSAYVGPYAFHDVGTSNLGNYVEKSMRIWNVGRGPLDGNITFTSGINFSCQPPTTGCSFSIPEGTYKDVIIRFAPLAVGSLNDTARFNSNAFNGLQTVQVHGTGIFASIINILGTGQNFPPTVIGKWKEQTITIRNTGTVDFGTGVFSLTGPFTCVASTAGAAAAGSCPYNLIAGGTTVITVRFAPLTVGAHNGLVSLSTLPLANFFVSGAGINPSIKFIEK